ncbi:MAG: cation transporter [Chloroflexi bacterium]|nr:cation transporter [Chloroflexota bacterium]
MRRALLVMLAANLGLAALKGGVGLAVGSLGMAADGLHSLLHALGSLVGLVGVTLAARPPDRSHPYGYERYEPLSAVGIVGLMLLGIREILAEMWSRLSSGGMSEINVASVAVMALASAATFALARWERRRGEQLGSAVLATDGQRALSDVFVSLSVLAGLVAALLGVSVVDPLVSLAIVAVIGWTGWAQLRELSAVLTDAAVTDLEQIASTARQVPGVGGVHRVRARGAAGSVRVDLHVTVDPAMPAAQAHELTHRVVQRVRRKVGGITEVLVHVGVEPEPDHEPGEPV